MTRSIALALAMAGLLGAAWAGPAEAAGPVIVQLTPQNNSGEAGTATLSEQGTKTKVVVGINGAPAGVAQPCTFTRAPALTSTPSRPTGSRP
jgi:hypothetical protein